jgi:DNA-binding MarR family transcriptional regulator
MPDAARDDEAPSGSAARALRVLSEVMRADTLTPAQLCEATGLSRTAVHRAIHALIDEGFLRYQLDHSHVTLTNYIEDTARSRKPVRPEIERISRVIEEVRRGTRVHVDLAMLTRDASFQIMEATEAERIEVRESLLDSDLFAMALTLFDPVDVVSITTAVLKRERGSTHEMDPEFLDRYRHALRTRFLWDEFTMEYTAPLCRVEDYAYTIRLWSRETRAQPQPYFLSFLKALHKRDPEMFPEWRKASE